MIGLQGQHRLFFRLLTIENRENSLMQIVAVLLYCKADYQRNTGKPGGNSKLEMLAVLQPIAESWGNSLLEGINHSSA
jgi:hypothetical protein